MNSKRKHTPKTKTNKKATKSSFHLHFHSFALTLGLRKVVDIKSNEKPEKVTTDNENQRKAAKRNKKPKQTLGLKKFKEAIKN